MLKNLRSELLVMRWRFTQQGATDEILNVVLNLPGQPVMEDAEEESTHTFREEANAKDLIIFSKDANP